MFCENCGTQLDTDARFCHSCGMSVSQDSHAPYRPASQPTVPRKHFPLGIFLIAVLCVVLVGCGFFIVSNRNSLKNTPPDVLPDSSASQNKEAVTHQVSDSPNPEYEKVFEKLGYTDIDEDFGDLSTMSFIEQREGEETTIYEMEIAYEDEYVVEIAWLTYRKNPFDTMNEMMGWLEKTYEEGSYRFSQDFYVVISRFSGLDTDAGMRAYLQRGEDEEVSPMIWYNLRDAYLELGYIMK